MKPLSKILGGTLVLGAGIVLLPMGADAALVLEEQFDYATGPVAGNNGGRGFADPWTVNGWSRNYEINTLFAPGVPGTTTNANGGLEFPGLPTAGSALARYGTAGQREAHRTLTAASQALLTANNSTIWFSVLAGAPSGNKFGTLIFGTDPMVAQQTAPPFPNGNLNAAAGQAFGVGFRIDNAGASASGSGSPNAVAFINSDVATVSVGSFLPNIAAGATHHDTSLIVGRIDWSPNGTNDVLSLFNITNVGDPEPALGDAIATLSADFDQSNFNVIGLWDTGSTIFDEIRFGTSYADVLIPEPSGVALLGLGGLAFLLRRRR